MDIDDLESSELYSEELDIDLSSGDDDAVFEWFLASVLFGGRISEDIAKRTYRAFERHDLLTPGDIVDAGFDFLVDPVMQEGGYVRYDNQRSEQILRNCRTLLDEYDGRLNELHEAAEDEDDLEDRLDAFYGVGPVTVNIFLRELRPVWEKSDLDPLDTVRDAAERHDVDLDRYDRKSETFARVEAGLVRRQHE
jgi:endonuclease III